MKGKLKAKNGHRPPDAMSEEMEEVEERIEEYIPRARVLQPWVSLGSELEMEEETVKPRHTKIKFLISRIHREFGSRVTFGDHNASAVKDCYMECVSYQDKRFIVSYKERDVGIQETPNLQDQCTQTKWTFPRNAFTQYESRQFPEEEIKVCLSSENLRQFLHSVSLRLELALQQNEIMNVFLDDWKVLSDDDNVFGGKNNSHLKEFQTFTEHRFCKEKTISCIRWHPSLPGLVAVSVTERLPFEERVNASSRLLLKPALIVIWSFADPIQPQMMLLCPDDIHCFQFYPSDPNIIAGGCVNGQVVLWDISAYQEKLVAKSGTTSAPKSVLEPKMSAEPPLVRYCAVSSIELSHKDIVTDIHWLADNFEVSRNGFPMENRSGCCVQLATSSPDCSVLFWDLRSHRPHGQTDKKMEQSQLGNPQGVPDTFRHLDLVWKPLVKVTMSRIGASGEYSPMKVSLSDEHFHSRTIEKLQNQTKEQKLEGRIDYTKLRASSAKNPKMLDDVNTKFFAGTEDGEVVYMDWKMEKDGDTGKLISSKPYQALALHDGGVHTVHRSPFIKDILLTVGGWSLMIWREGVTSGPILQSCCMRWRYTAAHWSPSRAGLFFVGREDGNVDTWDLLEKTHEPSQTQNISASMITSIKPWIVFTKQHFLAVGDDQGTLHVLEIPWSLHHASANELLTVQHYFDREVKHLEYAEQRRERRKARKRETDKEKDIQTDEAAQTLMLETMEEIAREYGDFLQTEQSVMTELGLVGAQV
uniref:Dynein axonemal intermediate chain 3 n=2 Tax=Leptobrachium leishanense TaxID=445787 RepID=A0A8C5Q007_9ANUR